MARFDIKKFMTENKLTRPSQMLNENDEVELDDEGNKKYAPYDKRSELGKQIPKPEGDREVIGLPNNVEEGYEWLADFVYENPDYYDVYISRWENGESEFRIDVGESKRYHQWVKELKSGEDGPETYGYSEGIAP